MRKTSTFLLGSALILLTSILSTNAQIKDFDPLYYYKLIMATGGKVTGGNAIGDPGLGFPNTQIAQLQPLDLPVELWWIVQVTDSTYRLINKGTQLALSRTNERPAIATYVGTPGAEDVGQTFPYTNWPSAGYSWPGIATQFPNEADNLQVWHVFPIPEANQPAGGDTLAYTIVNMGMAYDSLFSINVWRTRSGPDYYGTQNFCFYSFIDASQDLQLPEATVFFLKTTEEAPVSINEAKVASVLVVAKNGAINIKDIKIGQSIQVFNILGIKISDMQATSSALNIDIGNKTGIYIVKIGDSIHKVLVQ
jgi:hypothetical protein